ncbi:transposase [Patescibacteria group bacterium]|nr:transposase [Patescibacteria group bacterium]
MSFFSIAKGFHKLTSHPPPNLTQKEQDRLRAITIYEKTKDVSLVCRTYGISRATLYRWLRRYDPKDLNSLRNKSRRPRRLRKPMWTYEHIRRVRELREQYPRWGKEKLCVLLQDRGIESSASTVGRIIGYLKRRGKLVEPVRRSKSGKRRARRPYAIRKPQDWAVSKPGDLVQVDTLNVKPLPGVALKQFTARDLISKWDVVEARSRATSHTAKEFIDTLLRGMPFKVKAIQVDGGSEFYSEFERECECRGIKLFVLPPRSPKLNGCVERAQRTHREEFYELCDVVPWTVPELNKELRRWEYVYNCIRPHQALGYKTPLQFLRDNGIIDKYQNPSCLSHM